MFVAIRQSFVIPKPGYFDLEDLKDLFKISSQSSNPDELFESINESGIIQLKNLISMHYLRTELHRNCLSIDVKKCI